MLDGYSTFSLLLEPIIYSEQNIRFQVCKIRTNLEGPKNVDKLLSQLVFDSSSISDWPLSTNQVPSFRILMRVDDMQLLVKSICKHLTDCSLSTASFSDKQDRLIV